ncbi:hypothetical protein VNI00_016977 [Paramarasmius palmivorus]|uniref:Uncharacterized protein n=1 Tax=Paramarasmius palmivorus TaxID=297713 RepID=A0AAW0BB63_9AGAR
MFIHQLRKLVVPYVMYRSTTFGEECLKQLSDGSTTDTDGGFAKKRWVTWLDAGASKLRIHDPHPAVAEETYMNHNLEQSSLANTKTEYTAVKDSNLLERCTLPDICIALVTPAHVELDELPLLSVQPRYIFFSRYRSDESPHCLNPFFKNQSDPPLPPHIRWLGSLTTVPVLLYGSVSGRMIGMGATLL